ncbi:hypothetical protein LTR10_022497 [Elasticomyces elasticus]|uniref:DUF3824 domain-containing protein n=1 Tax=Exophiala sideris TaxID=1016849 RepID=A0ABR0J7K0_9EURO|nr:hypothetical protein LTR10_022497 [Elasticomyces elasticus]KAK5029446.1 hypothetical protein LTS07_005908 [Exophiala sideris]KAK5036856.1 hypothetical protein LTR13_005236 [Exophiala sideris]KAK5058076.1 hypothetical protein LTR69_007073 [Exophiala sideris]KAK5182035.1 hypothetical protein LTR44_005636 [Eurotiomycetes sp. CCFEE 6388]
MGSVYRDRDRYDDSRTSVSSARRDGGYTTVKRYVVKEEDTRSSAGRDRRFVPERAGERVEETRIVRREREVEEPVRESRRDDPRVSERELVIRRKQDDEPRRDYYDRDYYQDNRRDDGAADREIVIRRTTDREEPRRDDARYDDRGRESRYRDGFEVLAPPRVDDRDLQKYIRTSEYFSPAPPPQTIIIRQEPIIIRERVRDDDYQIVRKSDVDDERSVVRSRDQGRDQPRGQEEDFFYEKKVRERLDDPRRDRDRDDDDYYERRSRRGRSVSPHDSVSQRGGRDDYSSDDSMVYVRKEVREDESPSPHRRRDLAAGVAAGVAANELFRHHKKEQGQDTSHGIGRIGRDVGAGALGALAAEGIRRARSAHRSRSRRRERSRSEDSGRSRSRRSRSRSKSPSKLKTLGVVGLGAAALAAAATIATKRMQAAGNDDGDRRSRSRRRSDSASSLENDTRAPGDTARNPTHRKKRMAEAGAAGAIVAGLIERARSKSRARDGKERSSSRIKQALPVVAAGIGSAALAGLYEKNKAKKEAQAISQNERRAPSRSRSRGRSDAYYDGPSQGAASDPAMLNAIEYGNGPMHGNNFGPDYYGRPPPQEGYYGTSNAVVPAATGAAADAYGAQRARSRSRSLSRERGGRRSSRSSSSSPDRGHSRRRSRDAGKSAAAAAGGAAAASEYESRRKQEKRDRKARKRREEQGYGADPYEDSYNPAQQYSPTPPPANDPYATQQGFYPQSSQFPPPPGAVPQQYPQNPASGAANPYPTQSYPPPPPPPGPPPTGAANYDPYASGANPYAPRGPENVSAEPSPEFGNPFTSAASNDQHHVPDGLNASPSAPPAPPIINVQPPSTTGTRSSRTPDTTSPAISGYVPPTDTIHDYVTVPDRATSPTRSRSQPPSTGRKSVQFAEAPQVTTLADPAPVESEASSPERPRHRHKHSRSGGYEAEEDTDTTADEVRRRSREQSSEFVDPESTERKHHRRRRSHEPTSSRGEASSSSKGPELERVTSPNDSDATVELPPRFDEKGRKRTDAGDDPLGGKIEDILAGKGAAGKVFGNFLDGLFGPDDRRRKGR